MASDQEVDRRSFLKYGGTTAAAAVSISLAGCTGDTDDDADDDPAADDDPITGDDDDDTVTDDDDDDDDDDVDEDFHVTVTQGTLTDTLDPVGENATPVYNILDQTYEPFLYRDRDGRPVERLVTDWERVDDNTISLTPREDVQFHSGSTMTAEDVAFSINRANDGDVSDVAGVIGDIDEAYVEDGEVMVDLNAVIPEIFRNLTAFGRVVEQEWVEERDGDITLETNGTGPLEIVEFEEGSHVDYEKFDDYWGPEIEVDTARFNAREEEAGRVEALLQDETDIITNVPPRDVIDLEGADNADSEIVPSIRSIFLVMNDAKEPFDSLEFRQAMNYAVDVDAIIESQLEGFADETSQPTLEDHFGYSPNVDPYPYDPNQAEDLVEQSGHAGADIELHTTTGRYLADTDVADAAAGQIDELDNVSCSSNHRATLDLFGETADGDQDTSPAFFLIGWGNPTFDADYTMTPWFRVPPFKHFSDDDISGLLEDAADEPDVDEREELLQEANELAHERAPWVFLYQQFSIYGSSDRIDWDARQDEDILLEEVSRS